MPDPAPAASRMDGELQAIDRSLATVTFAMDGSILRANANFLRLFGYKAREIIGLHHTILVPKDDREASDALWARLERGEVQTAGGRRLCRDGSDIWIQATYTPVLDDKGRPVEVVTFAVDVTAQQLQTVEDRGQIAAISSSQAVVHLMLDGTITDVNDVFLKAMGYEVGEVVGQNHRMFVEPGSAESAGTQAFWSDLAAGRRQSGEYKRLGKDGREVWLQATYNPIVDLSGRPFKVVQYATDVTRERLLQADREGQIAAIHKSHGVITFDMHGTVIDANDLFLTAIGYRLDEVEGRHHRMFVDPSYTHGPEYATFWDELSKGHHQAGEYKRVDKNGREVWLQATYNPVFDPNGKPFKVVKYATELTREKLRQADHQGQIAAIHKAQCVISFQIDGTIIDANDNFLTATGYRLAEVRGRHHRMFVDTVEAESAAYAAFWQELGKGRHQASEYRRLCKNGQEIWLRATYTPIFDMNGRPFKVVKYATDVTQERLRQADYEGQIAAIQKSQCVVAFDMDGTILDANSNFLAAVGYDLEEIKGRHHRMFVEPYLAASEQYARFWETLRSGAFLTAKFKRIGKGGKVVWIQASYNPILDLNGKPFKIVKIAADVTADVALAADLHDARRQAQHDSATSLPNRVRLASFMEAALAEPGARLAVLYLDLDHFKPINDTFGHHVGDHVLGETAGRLRGVLRPDQLAARIGGDEFVVAAPNLSDEDIEALCQRLIALVKTPIRHEKGTLTVGLSIGVAVSPHDAQTGDDLLRCADVALYRSKGNGRGAYSFFASDMNKRTGGNLHLADDMLHGIKAGQFFLDYQPRFHARTRKIQAVEALVRWAHPTRGRIEPADFIPLAEKSGLIVPLGEFVLRMAAHAALAWPGIGVSVNISPVQFQSSDLIEAVEMVLAETGLEADRLQLEITEKALTDDEERSYQTLEALKARGVRLAMDDFRIGRSFLGYLRAYPFDAIKIQQPIAEADGEDGGRDMFQAILALGKTLGIAVTAENVESTGQLLGLNPDEYSEVQGFLLAEPMPAAQVSALLALEAMPLARTG